MSTVFEMAMARMGFNINVDVATVMGSARPDLLYLVVLNTSENFRPEALISLRGYLCGELQSSIGMLLAPESMMVVALDKGRADVYAERISRFDVLSRRMREQTEFSELDVMIP